MTLIDLKAKAEVLDRTDPLAGYRERFHIPAGKTYLCGNSLGLMPKAAAENVERELKAWRELGVEGHFKPDRPWVSFHELCTDHLAKLVGAKPIEVVAMNTLTVNLHLMLTSFYGRVPQRQKVLIGHSAFPSDRYAIASQLQQHGRDPAHSLIIAQPRASEATLRTEDVVALIEAHRDELELVLMDGVNYYTGEFLDIPTITAAAHKHDIIVGFDLAHAVGNVPLQLHDWGVDFAVWCSYKYLNGGPGCPAGCFVHERHATTNRPRLAGWWGHDKATRFQMGPDFQPIPGAEGWQLSNPPLFSMAALLASLELYSQVGLAPLREKSVALTGLLDDALRSLPGIEILTPADPARRGCQMSVRVAGGKSAYHKLEQAGIVCDWREPDVIRLAPVPFYNRFADVVRVREAIDEPRA